MLHRLGGGDHSGIERLGVGKHLDDFVAFRQNAFDGLAFGGAS